MQKDNKLAELRKHSLNNEIEILKSEKCSCFFCRQTYSARNVNDWISDKRGVTAICPECGMDAVIGDACGIEMDKALLKELNLAYYGEDYMEKHPNAAAKYVKRYKEGKITHKKANESLYIQYLTLLASMDNSRSEEAAFDLGKIYEFGTEFTEPNLKTAFSFYAMRPLKNNSEALCRLGMIALNGAFGNPEPKSAYECFCKAMALGGEEGMIKMIDCYIHGINVHADADFAFECAATNWPDIYQRFVLTNGQDDTVFAELAYRLGKMTEKGQGTPENPFEALKFYLMAQFGYEQLKSKNYLYGELIDEYNDCVECIKYLSESFEFEPNDPAFDNDTFSDSQFNQDECPFLASVPKTISLVSRVKEENSAVVEISYALPPFIIDVANLFCGFIPDAISWEFLDVKRCSIGKNVIFDSVIGNPVNGWKFYSHSNGTQSVVASIEFFPRTEEETENEEDNHFKA